METPIPSKRLKRRVVVRDYVHLEFKRHQKIFNAALVNISLQGLCCLSPISLEREEVLEFHLKIAQQEVSVCAKVKWIQIESEQRYKIGLEFKFLEEAQQEYIQNFLKEALHKTSFQIASESDPVRKAIPVHYGLRQEYQGVLISMHPNEVHFRGPVPAQLSLDQLFFLETLLFDQPFKTKVKLQRFEREAPLSYFVAEFQSLSESDRNLIRQFLVDHYLNSD